VYGLRKASITIHIELKDSQITIKDLTHRNTDGGPEDVGRFGIFNRKPVLKGKNETECESPLLSMRLKNHHG
jgi:hypothetical protein